MDKDVAIALKEALEEMRPPQAHEFHRRFTRLAENALVTIPDDSEVRRVMELIVTEPESDT